MIENCHIENIVQYFMIKNDNYYNRGNKSCEENKLSVIIVSSFFYGNIRNSSSLKHRGKKFSNPGNRS